MSLYSFVIVFPQVHALSEWTCVDPPTEYTYRVCLEVGEGKPALPPPMGAELGEGMSRALVSCPRGFILSWEQKSEEAGAD